MKKAKYAGFEALNPFFRVVLRGLRGLVDGKHYFDTIGRGRNLRIPLSFSGLAGDDSGTGQSDGQPRLRNALRGCDIGRSE